MLTLFISGFLMGAVIGIIGCLLVLTLKAPK